jgi:hypothetical protein
MEGFIMTEKKPTAIKTISERIQAANQNNAYVEFRPRKNSDKDDQAKKELTRRLSRLRA